MIAAALFGVTALAGGATAPLPSGVYAMRLETATLAELPFVGETRGGSVSWLLGWRDDPVEQLWSWKTCAVEMTAASGRARMMVPPAFLSAISTKELSAQLAATSEGWRLEFDMGVDHVGYTPNSIGGVPTSVDDHRVFDWDSDGHPAATIRLQVPVLGGVELYVAQRAHLWLTGFTESGSGLVAGTVRFLSFEQRTLGASNRMFVANPRMVPDPVHSGFEIRRLGDHGTCEGIQGAFAAAQH